VDKQLSKRGSLLADMQPPVNPPETVDDPSDSKPADWVDAAQLSDPAAVRPADWDEDQPRTVPDPDAVKPPGWLDAEPQVVSDPAAVRPADWEEEEDGPWLAPTVPNPACQAVGCGEWRPASVKNPLYRGKWSAPLIDNPDYKGAWTTHCRCVVLSTD
jgi:hypothetical protein